MHIVIADQLPASAIEILRSVPGWTVDARTQRAASDLARDLAEADALIVRSATTVDSQVLANAPRLRVIARAGTGVDNVDVSAATARGIVVMNSPGANSVSVAEHAMALMLAVARAELLASAVVAGVLQPLLSSAVTIVNARSVAVQRGIEIVETRSSRPRDFTNLLSVKLQTSEGERWVEGTVFEPGSPRLASVDGVEIEAPLEGTLVVITNNDQPGVIGEVGTILGRHNLNIANFALGRGASGAVGLVKIDEPSKDDGSLRRALDEIRSAKAIRTVALVRV
jgi:predicted amino acid-binding ACT domain protein